MKITRCFFMLGLGEKEEEVTDLLRDLKGVCCDMVTTGQYLQPNETRVPVSEYVSPERFEDLRFKAEEIGLRYGPGRPLCPEFI